MHPVYYAHGGFPWGLLIIGAILFFAWKNGVFTGPGRFGNGPRYGGWDGGSSPAHLPEPPAPGQGGGSAFHGPRAMFEEWHRQAHEATPAHPAASAAPTAPPAPAAPRAETRSPGAGEFTQ